MSEEPPRQSDDAVYGETSAVAIKLPLTTAEFTDYLHAWRDDLPLRDLDREDRQLETVVIDRLLVPQEPEPGKQPLTPDKLVEQHLVTLGSLKPKNESERKLIEGQTTLLLELWDMMDHPENQRNMRAEGNRWKNEQRTWQDHATSRPEAKIDEDAAAAARRVMDEPPRQQSRSGDATPARTRPLDEAAVERARAQIETLNLNRGPFPRVPEKKPDLAETPVATPPNVDGVPGRELFERARRMAATFDARRTPEDKAARRGVRLTREEQGVLDSLVTLGSRVRDDLCRRYGITMPSPDEIRQRTRATPAGRKPAFKGDIAGEAKRIRSQALTVEEARLVEEVVSVLVPLVREGYVAASDISLQLGELDKSTITLDNPTDAERFLSALGWQKTNVDRILGHYRGDLAKRPRAWLELKLQRDRSTPNPADGRLIETPLVGLFS